jgi:hypothetical protein
MHTMISSSLRLNSVFFSTGGEAKNVSFLRRQVLLRRPSAGQIPRIIVFDRATNQIR